MIRNAFMMLTAFSLLGCNVEANIEASQKREAEYRARPAYIKWEALTDLEQTAAFNIAVNIAKRCGSLTLNKREDKGMEPVLNRVTVFKGKSAVIRTLQASDEAFLKKYGKPLRADLNHCDAGETELRQQTAISILLDKA